MRYFSFPPPLALAPYIRFFWVLESDFPGSYVHRTLASGCPEIVFHYSGRFSEVLPSGDTAPSFLSGITGQTTCYNRYAITGDFGIFGVFLYPFAVPALFGVPASAISSQSVSLGDLCGAPGEAVSSAVLSAPDNATRYALLSSFFCARLRHLDSPVLFAVRSLVDSNGRADLGYLSDQCFRSRRQFERLFLGHAGFSPRLFARLCRFHGALERYGDSSMSLTGLAYELGYYDQSHFIHEFKEFSGHHPRAYFSGRAEAAQWKG